MVSSINNIMFNLDMLNKRSEKNTYGLSSGDALQYGSDNSKQYNEILSVKNNVKSYTSILDKIQLSGAYNDTSDSAVSNMKNSVKSVQSLVLEALNGTNNSDTKEIIAANVESIKDTIFNLLDTYIKEFNKELENSLKRFKESSINRFEKIEKEIKHLKIHTIIDKEITSLEANTKYEIFENMSLKIFLFMDNLFSGELGLLDMTKDDINYLKNKLFILMEKRNINKIDYINLEDIFYTIRKIPDNLEKEAISYISNHQVDFLNMQNTKSVISDLIKISSINDEVVFKKEIKENSKISEFITYENYIDMSIREFI